MKINVEDCIACGQCQEYCPFDAIVPIEESNKIGYLSFMIDQDMCVDCGECLNCDCPGGALVRS